MMIMIRFNLLCLRPSGDVGMENHTRSATRVSGNILSSTQADLFQLGDVIVLCDEGVSPNLSTHDAP